MGALTKPSGLTGVMQSSMDAGGLRPQGYLGVTSISACFPSQSVSCSVASDSLRPRGLQPVRLFCPQDSPGKNPGVGCHSLLQGIFPTQGLNLGLLHCRQILYHLNHQGSPLKIQNTSQICMPFLTNAKKKIIYHISLALSVDHREGRGI